MKISNELSLPVVCFLNLNSTSGALKPRVPALEAFMEGLGSLMKYPGMRA